MDCNYPDMAAQGAPLHQHDDGSWWWYYETWADEQGPYATKEQARAALERYCKEVLG